MGVLNIKDFPDDLQQELRKRARAERRSLAQEVIYLLERTLRRESRHSLLQLRGLGKEVWAAEGGPVAHVATERDSW